MTTNAAFVTVWFFKFTRVRTDVPLCTTLTNTSIGPEQSEVTAEVKPKSATFFTQTLA